MKKKILFLDFFRLVCAFCVFLFHSNIHIGARYGIFTPFVSVSALFMTAFFMLSGFVLSYNYSDSDLTEISAYFSFIKKRIIGIYPGYICVYVFFILGRFLKHEGFSFGDIVATPVELVLLQSVFAGSFSTLHNGGTWFISCIFVCYCLFPFFQKIFRQMNGKVTAIFLVFFYLVSSYAPVVRYFLNYFSIYANVFFRFVEFSIGMILGNLFVKREFCCVKRSSLNKSVGVCAVVGGGGISRVGYYNFFENRNSKSGISSVQLFLHSDFRCNDFFWFSNEF